jgi:hypothetical protein
MVVRRTSIDDQVLPLGWKLLRLDIKTGGVPDIRVNRLYARGFVS